MVKTIWAMLIALLWLPALTQAHNVVGGVYAIGNVIEGEVGFSNGDMAAEGTEVVISDASGSELARVVTDGEGLFTFEATQRIDHHFRANMSSGHVLELTLSAAELPESLPAEFSPNAKVDSSSVAQITVTPFKGDQAQLQLMIEKAVAKQVKPLRQELAALKEKAGLQDIIGGIGYIFGLCGLGIWMRQRHRDKQTQQDRDNASVS